MAFQYLDNRLFVENLEVEKIAQEVGTPVYIYSKEHFETQYRRLDRAFKRRHTICFAIKSNSNLSVISTFARLGSGADIVSGGELFRALKAGVDPEKIVFSGVAKTEKEMEYALKSGILMFNVESMEELYALDRVAGKLSMKAPVAFRVNPDVDPKTHPYISTGLKKNKFGIPYEEAIDAYIKARELPNIAIKGIQFHIGSQLLDSTPIYDASVRVAKLIKEIQKRGINIDVIDVGGGLGIVYNPDNEKEPSVETYAQRIEEAFAEFPDALLVCEPGRYLVGNGGILVSQVLYHKSNNEKHFMIVDAGMNDLLRPSLYNAYHRIEPCCKKGNNTIRCDIVGPICETGDFLARDYTIEDVQNGEYIVVFSAGAYGFTMASNYNSRTRAAEVLVDSDRYRVVRARETWEDLIKGEEL